MPGSYDDHNALVTDQINTWGCTRILDVGAGAGKWGKLLRKPGRRIEACEIHAPYVDQFGLLTIYDTVHGCDVRQLSLAAGQYDLAILGDVLEHLCVQDARALLLRLAMVGIPVLVLVPYLYPQGETNGNPAEAHLQPDLDRLTVLSRYPSFRLLADNDRQGVFTTFPDPRRQPTTDNRQPTTASTLVLIPYAPSQGRRAIADACIPTVLHPDASVEVWLDGGHVSDACALPLSVKLVPRPKLGLDAIHNAMFLRAAEFPGRYVYFTDADAFHDPDWLPRAISMYRDYQMPVCLYNTACHDSGHRGPLGLVTNTGRHSTLLDGQSPLRLQASVPGISVFLPIAAVRKIAQRHLPLVHWDWSVGVAAGPFACSRASYCGHYGAGGLHHDDAHPDIERNPTPALTAFRSSISHPPSTISHSA